MFHAHPIASPSFPRVRGDVPSDPTPPAGGLLFSPRARGCSWVVFPQFSACLVFPACAGMFRNGHQRFRRARRFPRVRGDVPDLVEGARRLAWFSPRARGCSGVPSRVRHSLPVFPACAGMFPEPVLSRSNKLCFPRVRGDVPSYHSKKPLGIWFSPRARGCSSRPPPLPLLA